MEPRVDFFIAGVQKAGTTALDKMLRGVPGIQMAWDYERNQALKEIHFFDDDDGVDWAAPNYMRLHSYFDWKIAATRGEATPISTYWPHALERIHACNPLAKLVIAFRHPTHRAFSHWCMEVDRGHETLSFAEAIRGGRQRVLESPRGAHRVFSYVERGRYDVQIDHALSIFPRRQIHFLRADRSFADPTRSLAEIAAFLGVAANVSDVRAEYIVPQEKNNPAPSLDGADKRLLDAEYWPGYDKLEALTGLDLSDWRDPAYEEPMRAND